MTHTKNDLKKETYNIAMQQMKHKQSQKLWKNIKHGEKEQTSTHGESGKFMWAIGDMTIWLGPN
jgi:hypothetical protein